MTTYIPLHSSISPTNIATNTGIDTAVGTGGVTGARDRFPKTNSDDDLTDDDFTTTQYPDTNTSTNTSNNPTNFPGSIPKQQQRSRSRSRSRSRQGSVSRQRSRSSATGSFINFISENKSKSRHDARFFSLYKLLMLELNISGNSPTKSNLTAEIDNQAYEQILDMVKIPMVLEKFMGLGLMICFNSFLTLFTLVPLRICLVGIFAAKSAVIESRYTFDHFAAKFSRARRDALTVVMIMVALLVLSSPSIDISKMYHDVRGQAQIKLYVMFGVLEVADKLCSSIGQNILSILYDFVTSKRPVNKVSLMVMFFAAIIYLSLHAYILIYQTVSLNVAANSYSNALLTLLLSNQFSELRGSVFKKFDREGLFQLSMSDLTERYQLSLMLGMISLRNILQMNSIGSGLLPNSWQAWNKWLGVLFGPSVGVLGSEILVDWLKHCYIAKFNRIKPRIYSNFIYVLALDYLEVFKASSLKSDVEYELSDYMVLTKRIGLPLLATTVCFLRMSLGDLVSIFTVQTSSKLYSILSSGLLIGVSFVILLISRLILGIILLKTTTAIKQNHKHRIDDEQLQPKKLVIDTNTPSKPPSAGNSSSGSNIPLSPRSPTPIELNFLPGSPNTEMSTINPTTRSYLYDEGEKMPPTPEEKRNKEFKEKFVNEYDEGLNKVSRYEMSSKRIW